MEIATAIVNNIEQANNNLWIFSPYSARKLRPIIMWAAIKIPRYIAPVG